MIDRVGAGTDTVGQFLDSLASGEPTPGGGAAAAVVAAMAAALVEMVCRFTLGRPKYAEFAQIASESLDRAAAIRAACVGDADADAEAFGAVAAALKLPRSSDLEQRERRAALEVALQSAADVPMGVAERCAHILALVNTLTGASNPRVASDLKVAASFAIAAFESALANVEINVDMMKDPSAVTRYRDRARDAQARMTGYRQSITAVLLAEVPGTQTSGSSA